MSFLDFLSESVTSLGDKITTLIGEPDVHKVPQRLHAERFVLFCASRHNKKNLLEKTFRELDEDKSGTLEKKEIKNFFVALHQKSHEMMIMWNRPEGAKDWKVPKIWLLQPSELDDIIADIQNRVDLNKDGKLEFNEFLEGITALAAEYEKNREGEVLEDDDSDWFLYDDDELTFFKKFKQEDKKKRAKEIFEAYDVDNSGKLDKQELKEFIRAIATETVILSNPFVNMVTNIFLKNADYDGDGDVDWEEFLQAAEKAGHEIEQTWKEKTGRINEGLEKDKETHV